MSFGSKAVSPDIGKVSLNLSNPWFNPPEYDDVASAFRLVGSLKAQIELLELEIDEIERKSRKGSRKADDIDTAKEMSAAKRKELTETKAKLRVAEYDLDFLNYRKDILRSVIYSNR